MRRSAPRTARARSGSEPYTPRPMSTVARADFRLHSGYQPSGDQPQAIRELSEGVRRGDRFQCLLGVTGSGKTFTMANVIARTGQPTLVISHNKTLAAQLYGEFRRFFPENAVEYFVSLLRLLPARGLHPVHRHLHREGRLDQRGHRPAAALRHREPPRAAATWSSWPPCPASTAWVAPEEFKRGMLFVETGQRIEREELLRELVEIQYGRNDIAFERGTFRVRGDMVEVFPAYEETALRIEFFGDEIERIAVVDPLTGEVLAAARPGARSIRPSTSSRRRSGAATWSGRSAQELEERLDGARRGEEAASRRSGSERAPSTTWRCSRRWATARDRELLAPPRRPRPGERPTRLLDYFPEDFLLHHRRVARDAAAGRGHVQRRPLAQADAGGARVPAAVRAGQPAAELR